MQRKFMFLLSCMHTHQLLVSNAPFIFFYNIKKILQQLVESIEWVVGRSQDQ